MKTTTFTITLDNEFIERLDEGRRQGVFLSRTAFIRYLLDAALTDWEDKQPDGDDAR